MESNDTEAGVRLAELVAAFSLATDLGLGQPTEHVLRSWVIAARIGERLGIGAEMRQPLYYIATLAWVGCVAETPVVAALFDDDVAFRRDALTVDRSGLPMLGVALRHARAASPVVHRLRLGAELVVTRGAAIERGLLSHCLTTANMAERLGMGAEIREPLQQIFTRWDGKGVPSGVAGEAIASPVRLLHLADCVEVLHRVGGVDTAIEVARARRGTQFDPAVVRAFCEGAGEILADLDEITDWSAVIDGEPYLQQRLNDEELDTALEAIADFTDLRSPSRSGHSRAVAGLAAGAAAVRGLPEKEVVTLRRAGLVHDLGMHGLPATILDKPGPLTTTESERVRMTSYYTERMLARTPALARIGAVASLTNERLDGSGYHRGMSGASIPAAGRIVAAADAFQAMTEPRPYRPALTAGAATDALRAEARAGRLATDAVNAVLTAAGVRRAKRRSGPSGLTEREIEVLVLIARGASNKQVARILGITPKTAGTHIERIYTKIGASTRSTATLFAMQQGLIDSLQPVDL